MGHAHRFAELSIRFDDPQVLAFFRRRHPEKTAHCLAVAAGVTARAAAKWLAGQSEPGFRKTLRLVRYYGPEFGVLVLPGLSWVADAALAARRATLEAERAHLDAELARIGSAS